MALKYDTPSNNFSMSIWPSHVNTPLFLNKIPPHSCEGKKDNEAIKVSGYSVRKVPAILRATLAGSMAGAVPQ